MMSFAQTLAALLLLVAGSAAAQETTYFRIGTGSTDESHFPIGGLIANAISNPPGSRECEKGGSCGVPGLIAVAQSTSGTVANIEALADGRLEAALAQSDVAYWAFHGTGPYKGRGAVKDLRAVAMLYPDSMHLVVRRDSGIAGVADLKGKRVSLGETGSGTLIDATAVLAAHGLAFGDVTVSNLRPGAAADALAKGDIDAFFVIDGPPVPSVAELARMIPIALVPIEGPAAEQVRREHPFMVAGTIAGGIYQGIDAPVPTLDVAILLLVSAKVPEDTVYGITRALWHPSTQKLLAQGHPRGKFMRLETATELMGIPLHAGAAAYYFDAGMVR